MNFLDRVYPFNLWKRKTGCPQCKYSYLLFETIIQLQKYIHLLRLVCLSAYCNYIDFFFLEILYIIKGKINEGSYNKSGLIDRDDRPEPMYGCGVSRLYDTGATSKSQTKLYSLSVIHFGGLIKHQQSTGLPQTDGFTTYNASSFRLPHI